MRFKLEEKDPNEEVKLGDFICLRIGAVYLVCFDNDRGYCLLDIRTSKIETDFYPVISELLEQVTPYRKIEQQNELLFK